jgi:hypothetical protein
VLDDVVLMKWLLTVAVVLLVAMGGYCVVFRSKCLSVVGAARKAMTDMDQTEGGLHDRIEELEQAVVNEERRRGEVVQTIVSIQKERDGWKDQYLACAMEHGVAQDIMMQEIQHLQALLRAHSIKKPENARVRNVSDEFRQKYLNPEFRERFLGSKPDPKIGLGDAGGRAPAPQQNQVDLEASSLAVLPRG